MVKPASKIQEKIKLTVSGTDNIFQAEVTHQVQYGDRLYGYAQCRHGAVSVARRIDSDCWRIVNAVGEHHSPDDFDKEEHVWVDLAGHLHIAKITHLPRGEKLNQFFQVLYLESDGSVGGGGSCELEQLVKLEDWLPEHPCCPFPRFDMLKG